MVQFKNQTYLSLLFLSVVFSGCLPQAATIEVSPSPMLQERTGVDLPPLQPVEQTVQESSPSPLPSTDETIIGLYKNWIGKAVYSLHTSEWEKVESFENGLEHPIEKTISGTRLTAKKDTTASGTYFTQADDAEVMHTYGWDEESAFSADGGLGSRWGFSKKLPGNMMQVVIVSYSFPKEATQDEKMGIGKSPDTMTYQVFISKPFPVFPLK